MHTENHTYTNHRHTKSTPRKLQKLCAAIALLILTACGTQKSIVNQGTGTDNTVDTKSHVAAIMANQSTQKNLTAKVRVEVAADGKRTSTSGTLRMKRDDVIQLILVDPLIGAVELGRMEFTKTHVLIIDKVNRQYIDMPYSDVDFLARAGINFDMLQALFWNQLFTTGTDHVSPSDFRLTTHEGGLIDLTRTDHMLTYRFTTQQTKALITQTEITGTTDNTYKFDFKYADFTTFEGHPFPKGMTMEFYVAGKPASLSLSLSQIRNSADWVARSTPSSKYTKADPEQIFKMLVK